MGLHVFLGSACVAVLVAGSFGFQYAIPVAALFAVGFGVKKFLDTRRSVEPQDGEVFGLDEPVPEANTAAPTSKEEHGPYSGGTEPDFNPASYLHSVGHLSRRWCRVSGESDRFDRSPG